MTALEPGDAGAFMRRLGPAIDAAFGRPKAIVMVSAHTMTREPVVLAAAQHPTIHDFGGFDPKLQTLRYDAPGDPPLAKHVLQLLINAGLPGHMVAEGGLDHGIWTVLRYVYPETNIPVVPLAWVPTWAAARQFELGEALAPLRREGVLLIGSGSITHNLRLFMGNQFLLESPEVPESLAFREWFASTSAQSDWDALLDYRHRAPHAVAMHPTDEHLLPWHVAAGAAGRIAPPLRLHSGAAYGCIGMDAYAFGPEAQLLRQTLAASAPNT